ncbi:MAG: GC-type dockerin domain-anchored protein [Phycisphaerales bacterium]
MTRTFRLTTATIACAVSSPALPAGDDFPFPFWIGGDGAWSDAASWSTGEIPTAGESVIVNNDSEVTLDLNLDLFSLAVGFNGDITGLSPFTDHATFHHPAGRTVELGNALVIGGRDLPNSAGTFSAYFLEGQGTLRAPGCQVGLRGNGILQLEDGASAEFESVSVAPVVEIGNSGLGRGQLVAVDTGTRLIADRIALGERGAGTAYIARGASVRASNFTFASSTTEQVRSNVDGENAELVIVTDRSDTTHESIGIGATTFPVIPEDQLAEVWLSVHRGGAIRQSIPDGTASITIGRPGVLAGDGTIHVATVTCGPGGRIEPGFPETGILTIDALCFVGGRHQDAFGRATVAIDLGEGLHDRLIVRALELGRDDEGARLEVTLDPGLVPALGDRFEIITMTDQGSADPDGTPEPPGHFVELTLPNLAPLILRPIYTTDRVELVVACPADLNTDAVIDMDDADLFVQWFLDHDPVADLTLDGRINFDDIDAFVESFLNGC